MSSRALKATSLVPLDFESLAGRTGAQRVLSHFKTLQCTRTDLILSASFPPPLGHVAQGEALRYYATRVASVLAELRIAAIAAQTSNGYGVALESDSGELSRILLIAQDTANVFSPCI